MKATILLVAGTVGLFSAPAVAGTKHDSKKRVSSVEKTDAAKPADAPELAPAAVMPELPTSSSEMLAMPTLPRDTSSALNPFPELEARGPLAPVAAKPVKASKDKAPVMKMGKDYMLGHRQSAKPTEEVEQIIPKSLSQAQVATVVQSHMAEIQTCWNAIPKQLRVDACTADLKLGISESGAVTDIEIGGDVPAAAHKCISSTVARWSFPVAETHSDVEYGISLRSL